MENVDKEITNYLISFLDTFKYDIDFKFVHAYKYFLQKLSSIYGFEFILDSDAIDFDYKEDGLYFALEGTIINNETIIISIKTRKEWSIVKIFIDDSIYLNETITFDVKHLKQVYMFVKKICNSSMQSVKELVLKHKQRKK